MYRWIRRYVHVLKGDNIEEQLTGTGNEATIAEAKIEGILGRLQQLYAQEREWLAAAGDKGLKPTPEEAEDVFRACGRLGSSSSKSPSEEAAKPAPTEQQLQALAGASPRQPPPASTKTGGRAKEQEEDSKPSAAVGEAPKDTAKLREE